MIAHLLGFGAVTRDGVRSVLMGGSALSLLDELLDSLISGLKLEGPRLELLSGAPLTQGNRLSRQRGDMGPVLV